MVDSLNTHESLRHVRNDIPYPPDDTLPVAKMAYRLWQRDEDAGRTAAKALAGATGLLGPTRPEIQGSQSRRAEESAARKQTGGYGEQQIGKHPHHHAPISVINRSAKRQTELMQGLAFGE